LKDYFGTGSSIFLIVVCGFYFVKKISKNNLKKKKHKK